MPSSPKVSVIIPHYHDLASLDRCLSALEGQTYSADQFEIVVADNASPEGLDEVRAVIRGRAVLEVVAHRGAGPARNGGVKVSRAEVLAFTDADCVPERQWLEHGMAAMAQSELVGGAMRVLVEDEANITPAEAFERVFAFDNRTYVLKKRFSVTANLFCSRAVFDEVGPFAVGVSEDVDWCHRAVEAGHSLGYAADAVVGHPARRDWAQLKGKWRRITRESFLLTAVGKAGRAKWLLRTLALPFSAVAHTPKVLLTPALTSPSARMKALGQLYQLRLWRFQENVRMLLGGAAP